MKSLTKNMVVGGASAVAGVLGVALGDQQAMPPSTQGATQPTSQPASQPATRPTLPANPVLQVFNGIRG